MMRSRIFPVILLAASVGLAQQAQAPTQAKPAEQRPEATPFQVQVNEVVVPVTVTDETGKFVSDLEAKDFKIYEDGREQKIVYFNRERNQPVVVGFILDISNATRLHWKSFQEAAMQLVWNLLQDDDRTGKFSGFLVTYGNEAELAVNTTTDADKIAEYIRKLKPGGGAALFDGIHLALTRHNLVQGEPIEPRRVLVIIGDGHDNASRYTLEEVIEIAQRNLVTIHCVSTSAFGFTSEGESTLTRLAQETGGRVEYPLENVYSHVSGYLSTPSDEGNYALRVGTGGYASALATSMFNAIANIAGEVTTQYILRYIPDNTDSPKQFRTIRVEVNLPGVKLRYRRGYYPYAP
ncbi:MAG TPA: VWA domain-containing protein [Bryobacteraceae bacterium]|nr:VWA domain-containing protein [Bryobacteraceae bacterium]HOL72606.1 VWA domain-containing protein [Bryobacteraceae bacterium]HOQ45120.1 VWA domain-containing protein [Bryobacteraceae bacterium]HPU71192.1 VWA domain-containing protein [Bryobacteraceae bacterium]